MAWRKIIQRAFSEYLMVTNVVMGSGFMLAGDVLAQKVTKKPDEEEKHDWERTKNMTIMGVGFGTIGHFWYGALDRIFPGSSFKMIRRKLLMECAGTPAFAAYTFFSFGTLQGKTLEECGHDMRQNLPLVCLADWGGYVPAQFFNFYYLPPRFRFLYVCGLMVIYDCFLAWLLNKPSAPKPSKG